MPQAPPRRPPLLRSLTTLALAAALSACAPTSRDRFYRARAEAYLPVVEPSGDAPRAVAGVGE